MKVELNTCLFPLVDVGMHCSILSPDTVFADWLSSPGLMDDMSKAEAEYCELVSNQSFNTDVYKQLVTKYAMEIVAEFFQDIGDVINVKLDCNAYISSPSEYNKRSDWLHFKIEITEAEIDKIKKAATDNHAFCNWLSLTYYSCPGFVNCMPNTIEWFNKSIDSDDIDRALAAFFTFLLRTSLGYSGNEEFGNEYKLYERISSNHTMDEFITDNRFQAIITKAYNARRAGG